MTSSKFHIKLYCLSECDHVNTGYAAVTQQSGYKSNMTGVLIRRAILDTGMNTRKMRAEAGVTWQKPRNANTTGKSSETREDTRAPLTWVSLIHSDLGLQSKETINFNSVSHQVGGSWFARTAGKPCAEAAEDMSAKFFIWWWKHWG